MNLLPDFRAQFPPSLYQNLLDGLYDESTLIAYNYAQIIITIAADRRTPSTAVSFLLSELTKAACDRNLDRGSLSPSHPPKFLNHFHRGLRSQR